MLYFDLGNTKISKLGLGCMRLPTKNGNYGEIDKEKTAEMVDLAIKSGINYFDTAWGYHNGQSEYVIGEILSKYPRESFYLTSKFPGYELSNIDKVEEIFEKQLQKCGVEYFDFYLFHSISEGNIDAYLDRSHRIYDYLKAQKQAGRIRHIGFSTHGTLETTKRFMDAYGDVIEFCQIQLNWLDYTLQDAKAKVDYFKSLNIPLWIMEPVRGGALCTLPKKYENKLKMAVPDRSLAEWCFRYIQSIGGIGVTLSGMSNIDQLKENISIFSEDGPLSADELSLLYGIADEMIASKSLPCTSCRYCTTKCPMELDIPYIISLYNTGDPIRGRIAEDKILALDENKRPSACIGCRACEQVCPQNIKISEMMQDYTKRNKL